MVHRFLAQTCFLFLLTNKRAETNKPQKKQNTKLTAKQSMRQTVSFGALLERIEIIKRFLRVLFVRCIKLKEQRNKMRQLNSKSKSKICAFV